MCDTLLVKIASRGDLLLSAPAIRALRARNPHGHITLVVGSTCADVGKHLPNLDDIITIEDSHLFSASLRGRLRGGTQLLAIMREWHRRRRQTGSVRQTQVVLLHRDWRYAVVARLAGIPIRRGFSDRIADRFLTHAYTASTTEHHVTQYRGVAGIPVDSNDSARGSTLAGAWEFAPGERKAALTRASALGYRPDRGGIALGFGGGKNVKTRTELKSWPVSKYVELARALAADGHQVVWLGDSEDRAAIRSVDVGVQLAGELTVSDTAAVVSGCQAVLANDTFVMHLGEALGIPTVGLFGPTDPRHTGPLGPASTSLWEGDALPCSPCHRDGFFPVCHANHGCMNNLEVSRAYQAVQSILGADEERFHAIVDPHGRQEQ